MSFYDDNDNDGLVNIIEYYFDQIGNYGSARSDQINLREAPIADLGLDPTDGDTDGDLLADGFEWYYGMDAKHQVPLKQITFQNCCTYPRELHHHLQIDHVYFL